MSGRRISVIFNESTLVAGVSTPPKLFHAGISEWQLRRLTGCVRRTNPDEFWHRRPLDSWVGERVEFILDDRSPTASSQTLANVQRIITAITVKEPLTVTKEDLRGTLAELGMQQCRISFIAWFRDVHGGKDRALIIRVRKP